MTRIGLCGYGSRARLLLLVGTLLTLLGALLLAPMARADGVPLQPGDVLADVGHGHIRHFTSTGTLVDTLNTTTGTNEGDGMCFDGNTNLFTTQGFVANTVSEFNKSGNLVTANFGSGYDGHPESCVVNQAGDVFVGQPDGSGHVLEFSPSGTLIGTFAPKTQARGTDWIDLASDQCTLRYTSEGDSIMQFNVCTNTQLADFATGLPGGQCFANRILSNGGDLVACTDRVVLLDASGAVVKTYPFNNVGLLFALNLDPDGKTFWTADYNSGQIWRVDIATGNIVTTFTSTPESVMGGLAIVGEITAAGDAKPTASGTSVKATEGKSFSGTVATVTDSDSAAKASDYSATINWGDGSSSSGTISGSGGSFTVSGSHSYSEEGSHTVTVTVTDTDNSANTATASSGATVADAPLSASGTYPSRHHKTVSGTVATFTDGDPGGAVSDYSASINWGDGSTSVGAVSASGGKFAVKGGHGYSKAGKYTITITIKDAGGSTATVTFTETIPKTAVAAASVAAKLSSVPVACVSSAFTARVQGKRIKSVRFTLDGRTMSTTTVTKGRRYTAQISVAPGHHALTVKVRFRAGSAASSRTFRRTVIGCPAPTFTG